MNDELPELQPISVVESQEAIRHQVTKMVDGKKVVLDQEGNIAVYNHRADQWEIFTDLKAVFEGAVWHRQFQRTI